jgi:subtilisin family serine protease
LNRATRDSIFRRAIWISLLATFLFVLAAPVWAAVALDSQGRPLYVDRQMIITLKDGTLPAQLDEVLSEIGARLVKSLPVKNTYLVELVLTRGEEPDVQQAVTRSASSSYVATAIPNYYDYPCASALTEAPATRARPTDPMWIQQWDMRMINMERAWDITKGIPSVIVAVIDSGVSSSHPEFQGRLVFPRDTADGDDDANPSRNPDPDVQEGVGHGTHVAGTIAAQGGNGLGIAGICWDNVKIMPIKAMPDDDIGLPHSAIIEGLEWAKNNGAHVVNMSIGGYIYNPAYHNKLIELDNRGIIIVAAAGNSYPMPVGYPAAYPEVMAVGSVGPTEEIAYYSCQGPEIALVAPGGDQRYAYADGVLSTVWTLDGGDAYDHYQGTSMACPHVAGAAAMLLSAGVPAAQVKSRLISGARPPNVAAPNPNAYGAGILDVYNSLAASGTLIRIAEPENGSVVDTVAPRFRITYSNIVPESITVYLDYQDANNDGIPDDFAQSIVIGQDNINQYLAGSSQGVLEFTLPLQWQDSLEVLDALSPGAHRIYVRAQRDDGSSVPASARGVFFVTPYIVTGGLHLFSIPYPLDPDTRPEELFATTSFTLSRLDPEYEAMYGTYAVWNPLGGFDESPNKYAWPSTSAIGYTGLPRYTLKRGTAFWLRSSGDMPVNVATQSTSEECVIRLVGPTGGVSDTRRGWNMFGNPFPFKVDWANVRLTYQGRTLPVVEAAAAGWIRPNLFRYSSQSGYKFQTAPQGVLVPWEGHWVYAEVGSADDDPRGWLLMTIPPLHSSSISRDATDVSSGRDRASSESEWRIRLSARSGNWTDSYNIAGVSPNAVDGYGPEDVMAPPPAPAPVSLSFIHRDWGDRSGAYQADIKNSTGSSKVWEFEVNAAAANQEVTISWPDIGAVPKDVNLTLEDTSAGSKIYMRTRSSYSFDSGEGGIRRFKMTAEPSSKGRLMITNVGVTRNRAGSVAISYSVTREARVEVRIRNAAGKHVKNLGGSSTRSAGIGTITWDSRSEDGQAVPAGAYLCEIVATGPDGEVVKTVQPVLLK